MSEALTCMRSQLARQEDIRIGIADLVDGTGASLGEGDNAGRMVTQRPDLMLLVAMSRAGARLVNRTSIGVVEWEMREAMARRLGEGREARVGDTTFPFRPVRVGEIVGSSFYVSGAVTEYNYNIYSDVQEAGVFGVTAGRRSYRVSVAVDLVVTRSTTTEVRLARSYGKQLVGQEVGVGVFRFLDMSVGNTRTELFEANIGQRQNEPVQAALRWVIETGAYDILSELFGRSETCDRLVPGYDPGSNAREAGDPRRPSSPAAAPGATPAPASPAAPAPAEILQFEQTAPEQPVAQQSPPAAQQQSRAAPPDAIPPPPAAARTVVAEQVARPSLMSAIARLFAAAPANDAGTAASPAHNGPAASATPPPATATVATATVATATVAAATVAAATAATPPPATATASVAPPATPLPATATAAAAATPPPATATAAAAAMPPPATAAAATPPPVTVAEADRPLAARAVTHAGGGAVIPALFVPGGDGDAQRRDDTVTIHLREIEGRSVVGFELPARVTYEVARRGERWVLLRFAGHTQVRLPEDSDARFLIRMHGDSLLVGSRTPLAVREPDRDGFVVIEQITDRHRPVAVEPRRVRMRLAAIGG